MLCKYAPSQNAKTLMSPVYINPANFNLHFNDSVRLKTKLTIRSYYLHTPMICYV